MPKKSKYAPKHVPGLSAFFIGVKNMMLSEQWLTSTDPAAMLAMIPKPSERRLRLWIDHVALITKCPFAPITMRPLPSYQQPWSSVSVREWAALKHADCSQQEKADLLREIFGNPFWSVGCECDSCDGTKWDKIWVGVTGAPVRSCHKCNGTGRLPDPITINPAWLTSNVVDLARGIYYATAWERMPILADALQEAGCEDEEILNHCRGIARCTPHPTCEIRDYKGEWITSPDGLRGPKGPMSCNRCKNTGFMPITHVRGCWLIDLLLGFECAAAVFAVPLRS